MEINAFKNLIDVTENKWYDVNDMALMFGFQLKLCGIDWRTNKELTDMLILAHEVGFLDVNQNPRNVKIKDEWYEYKSI